MLSGIFGNPYSGQYPFPYTGLGAAGMAQTPFLRGFNNAFLAQQARHPCKKSDTSYLTAPELKEFNTMVSFRKAHELKGADFGEI